MATFLNCVKCKFKYDDNMYGEFHASSMTPEHPSCSHVGFSKRDRITK